MYSVLLSKIEFVFPLINNRLYLDSLKRIAKEKSETLYAIYNDGALILNRENGKIELYGNVGVYK